MDTKESVDRARTTAHRTAIAIDQADLVAALNDKLGRRLVAFLAGKDTSTLTRWAGNKVKADEESLTPLRVAYQIIKMLERHEADATIRAWFIGMNPQLDDASPAEAIAEERYREAMAAARAFLAGG